jgi:hypothetical protein
MTLTVLDGSRMRPSGWAPQAADSSNASCLTRTSDKIGKEGGDVGEPDDEAMGRNANACGGEESSSGGGGGRRRGLHWERRRREKRAALGEETTRGPSDRASWAGAGSGRRTIAGQERGAGRHTAAG